MAKTASEKTGALIRSVEFFYSEVALISKKSTIKPYMEYFFLVSAGAPSCYLDM